MGMIVCKGDMIGIFTLYTSNGQTQKIWEQRYDGSLKHTNWLGVWQRDFSSLNEMRAAQKLYHPVLRIKPSLGQLRAQYAHLDVDAQQRARAVAAAQAEQQRLPQQRQQKL